MVALRAIKVAATAGSSGSHGVSQAAHFSPTDVTILYPGQLGVGATSPSLSNVTSVHGLRATILVAVTHNVVISLLLNGVVVEAVTILAGQLSGISSFGLLVLRTDLLAVQVTANGNASDCTVQIVLGGI